MSKFIKFVGGGKKKKKRPTTTDHIINLKLTSKRLAKQKVKLEEKQTVLEQAQDEIIKFPKPKVSWLSDNQVQLGNTIVNVVRTNGSLSLQLTGVLEEGVDFYQEFWQQVIRDFNGKDIYVDDSGTAVLPWHPFLGESAVLEQRLIEVKDHFHDIKRICSVCPYTLLRMPVMEFQRIIEELKIRS